MGRRCNPPLTLAFCSIYSIQYHFIRNIRGNPNLPQSPDIRKSMGTSDYWISGQSLIKEKCHNSRIRDDTDMKLGPATKIDKRNKITLKNMTMTSWWETVTSL